MLSEGRLVLGPEGDRFDVFAALHGVVSSLAFAVERRRACGNKSRLVARQEHGLRALATALARAFRQGDGADIEAIVALMARADALGPRGLPHERLIRMPSGWPLRGLPINPPALALCAVMRLGLALQDSLIAAASPRRTMQLRIVRDIQADALAMARDIEREAISPTAAALRLLHARFAAAEPMIGTEVIELLDGEGARVPVVMGDGWGNARC